MANNTHAPEVAERATTQDQALAAAELLPTYEIVHGAVGRFMQCEQVRGELLGEGADLDRLVELGAIRPVDAAE